MLNIFKTKEELDEDNKNEEETNTFSIDLEKFNKLYRVFLFVF